jgi:hypothetical protein
MSTLTHHKKSVRALVANPRELSFISAGADNMKKWLVFYSVHIFLKYSMWRNFQCSDQCLTSDFSRFKV